MDVVLESRGVACSGEWGAVPGDVYRHYKGGLYLCMFVAETHEHTGDRDVVYVSMTTGKVVTRPRHRDSRDQDSWTDFVTWPDGQHRTRFVRECDQLKALFA